MLFFFFFLCDKIKILNIFFFFFIEQSFKKKKIRTLTWYIHMTTLLSFPFLYILFNCTGNNTQQNIIEGSLNTITSNRQVDKSTCDYPVASICAQLEFQNKSADELRWEYMNRVVVPLPLPSAALSTVILVPSPGNSLDYSIFSCLLHFIHILPPSLFIFCIRSTSFIWWPHFYSLQHNKFSNKCRLVFLFYSVLYIKHILYIYVVEFL